MSDEIGKAEIFKLTGEILTAHVAHNSVPAGDLARLIVSVHQALSQAASTFDAPPEYLPEAEPARAPEPMQLAPPLPMPPPEVLTAEDVPPPVPMVPIEESVTEEYIVCLECGREMQMLKAHVQKKHGLLWVEYRRKWHLPKKYPAIAKKYASMRREVSLELGLGQRMADGKMRKLGREPEPPAPEPEAEQAPPPPPPPPPPAEPEPAVPVAASIHPDFLTCLECGEQLKSITMHLRLRHRLNPDEYKAKWHLPADYPTNAPNLTAFKAAKARETQLAAHAKKREALLLDQPIGKTRSALLKSVSGGKS